MQDARHVDRFAIDQIKHHVSTTGSLPKIAMAAGVTRMPLGKFGKAFDHALNGRDISLGVIDSPIVRRVEPDLGQVAAGGRPEA